MATETLYLTSSDSAGFPNHDDAETAVRQLASSGFYITKVTVIGRGFRRRIKLWGTYGAFWGGILGTVAVGIFLTVPLLGPVIVAGRLATALVAGIEGAIAVGGLTALGAALYGIGISKADALRYEAAIKADTFLVVVHGTATDVTRARVMLKKSQPIVFDVHHNIDMHARAASLIHR